MPESAANCNSSAEFNFGEAEIRGDIQPGDCVYKSIDAGKTWTHVGFSNSDAISHIRIHPTNPNIVFVSDFGKFGANSEERGIFKSTDGGKSWRKVLYKSPNAGGVDVEIDQKNPNVMYAALWEAYRKEWEMSSGGPASGLYKSIDGGVSFALAPTTLSGAASVRSLAFRSDGVLNARQCAGR